MQLTIFDEALHYKNHKKYIDGLFFSKEELIQKHHEAGRKQLYHILSFGAGTQSSVLLDMHFQGLIHYDAIIFSDTGAEPNFIHEQVAWWKERQRQIGNTTPFIVTSHHRFKQGIEEMLMHYIHTDYQRLQLPLYCNGINAEGEEVKKGLLKRQCTVDFKIVPVKQAARSLVYQRLGLDEKKRLPSDVGFIIDIGFSFDELKRISSYQSPQYKYIYLSYPLVEQHMTTEESIQYLVDRQLPLKRSRCYLCPFNCDDASSGMDWGEIIEHEPFSFLKAVYFDDQLRAVQATGSKYLKSIPYFHRSRKPLRDVYQADVQRLSWIYQKQLLAWIDQWEHKVKTNKYTRPLHGYNYMVL